MSDLIIEKVNSSCVHLVCEDGLSHRIYNVFSAYAPGYRFNPRFKMHVWDGKVRCYNPMSQILPIGLLNNLLVWCDQHNIQYSLQGFKDGLTDTIDKEDLEKQMNSYITAGFQARDYQVNAVHAALTNRRGVLLSCTGSGKSLMIYTFLRYLLDNKDVHRAILIVPSVSLVEQMYSDFQDYGWDDLEDHVEMLYSGKKPTFKKEILISTWQSLEKEDQEFFEVYDACVVDECVNENTMILTPDGEKKIKDLKAGDAVISYNEKTHEYETDKILEVHKNHISSRFAKMLKLELEDGKILEVTSNHPIYTTNRGWVRAGELTLDDDIEILSTAEEFLMKFFNVDKLPLSASKQKEWYLKIQKYISYKVLEKIPELKEILYEKIFLGKSERLKSLRSKIGGIIIGCMHKNDSNFWMNQKNRKPWNYNMAGNYKYKPWCTGKTKYTDERLMKISNDRLGDANPCSRKNKPDRSEMSAKQSNTLKEKILSGIYTPKTTNRLIHKKLVYDNKKFRSSWEVIFYFLHKNENLQYEKVRIPYFSNRDNKNHVYISDFYDKTTNTIYEVKPDRLMYICQKEKYEEIKTACKSLGYNFIHIGDTWKNSITNDALKDFNEPEILKLFNCEK